MVRRVVAERPQTTQYQPRWRDSDCEYHALECRHSDFDCLPAGFREGLSFPTQTRKSRRVEISPGSRAARSSLLRKNNSRSATGTFAAHEMSPRLLSVLHSNNPSLLALTVGFPMKTQAGELNAELIESPGKAFRCCRYLAVSPAEQEPH